MKKMGLGALAKAKTLTFLCQIEVNIYSLEPFYPYFKSDK